METRQRSRSWSRSTGWLPQSIQCVGDDEWTSDTASATLQVDQGEQIVCVFVNSQDEAPPTQAYLIVRKVAEGTDGTTGFPFTVAASTWACPRELHAHPTIAAAAGGHSDPCSRPRRDCVHRH